MPIITSEHVLEGSSTSSDEKGHRTHNDVTRVYFDDRSPVNKLLAWAAAPARHTPYTPDTKAFLKTKQAEYEGPYLGYGSTYLVTCLYSTDTPEHQWPWEEDPQIDCDVIEEEKIFETDQGGLAVVNSLGRKWEPGPTTPAAKPVLRIQKNFQTIDIPELMEYSFSTNDADFIGVPADSWLCRPVKWSKTSAFIDDVKVPYYRLSIEFVLNRELWYPRKILDSGYAYKIGDDIVAARNDDLSPATQPILLDGEGGLLPVDGEPVPREFDEFRQKDFTYFGVTEV